MGAREAAKEGRGVKRERERVRMMRAAWTCWTGCRMVSISFSQFEKECSVSKIQRRGGE